MRSSLLFALVLSVSRSLSTFFLPANAALVNRTIDDSDINAISYLPSANWHSSSNSSCSGCLKPNAQLALQQTFHYGIHVAPQPDVDDRAVASNGKAPDNDGDDGDDGDSPGSGKHGKGKPGGKRSLRLAMWRRADTDDPNFVDVNVTASLNFIGSAFYVYCVLPVQSDNATILSKTNLTFLVDGLSVGSFSHDPQQDSGSNAGFQYQIPVFSKNDLPYAQHALNIRAELGSMILLDYVQYSTLDSDSSSSSGGSASGTGAGTGTGSDAAPTPSGAVDSQTQSGGDSKKNTATFGAAIGSTVGVLALVSLGVFISLYRRRRNSAKRQKLFEAKESAARPPSPEMRGPQPFIPRYFPGTTTAPRSSPSPPPFSTVPGYEGVEELGPSHGLNLPPAPEHTEAPEYTPPPLVLAERTGSQLVTVPLLSPSALFAGDEDDAVPPRYQDAGRFPLVSVPILTRSSSPPPPPGLSESPSSLLSPRGGESPTSLTALSPGRPDFSPTEPAGVRADEPTIRENDDPRPR